MDDLSERWTKLAGLPSGPVPVESYRTQAFFELDRERILRRAWLASDEARFINGDIIAVDGGALVSKPTVPASRKFLAQASGE